MFDLRDLLFTRLSFGLNLHNQFDFLTAVLARIGSVQTIILVSFNVCCLATKVFAHDSQKPHLNALNDS